MARIELASIIIHLKYSTSLAYLVLAKESKQAKIFRPISELFSPKLLGKAVLAILMFDTGVRLLGVSGPMVQAL